MGPVVDRGIPGFQHTLAVNWVEMLAEVLLVSYSYIRSKVVHAIYCTSMMLGGIIGEVFLDGLVLKFEILLRHLVKQPETLHFRCAQSLLFNRVIHDAYYCRIIEMDWILRLWVTQFLQS